MATLRNKTTEDGSIVRWKPHPDHTRPSTYQITPRAIRLLGKIGYSASSPGDEVEIPQSVCRPLRVLGDLHFKSERPGEVNLDGVSKIREQSLASLTEDQQAVLKSYIESHPRYRDKAQNLLPIGAPRASSQPDDDESERPKRRASSRAKSSYQTPGIIPSRHVHIGRISRFSNANNAMFEPLEGRELNIGSLPKSTEGATTIGAKYASHFALCLTPQLWTSSYRNTVRDNLDELADRTGLKGLQRLLGIEDRQSPAELSESDVSVYLSILGTGYGIGFRGPWTVVVLSDHLSGHRKIRVEIVDDFDEILVARPIPVGKDSEPVGVGSNIEITVDEIRDSVIRGTYGPRLIEVHRTDSQPGKSLRAAITDIDEEHIVASVAALDESLRPSVGDLVTFEAGQLAEYPDIPVMIPASLPDVHTPLSLVVDSVETDGLRASVSKMPEFSSFSVGQELSVTADTWSHGIGITVVDGVPVTITEGRPLQEIPLRIEITEFTEGSAESRFIQADVPVDPTEDVATGLQSGDRLLQESEYEAALAELTSAVERALRTDPSQYTAARLREILAVGAVLKSKNELSSGIAFLESIDHQTEGLDESITQQLIAYRGILKADSLISDAANAEGVTATTYRRDAKEILEEAVDSLTPVTEPSTPSVHPLIVTALSQTSDQLILPPNAVTEYLDTV